MGYPAPTGRALRAAGVAGSKVLAKLAERVAPPSVRQHLAEQEAERERREPSRREEKAAKLAGQRLRRERRPRRDGRRRRARPARAGGGRRSGSSRGTTEKRGRQGLIWLQTQRGGAEAPPLHQLTEWKASAQRATLLVRCCEELMRPSRSRRTQPHLGPARSPQSTVKSESTSGLDALSRAATAWRASAFTPPPVAFSASSNVGFVDRALTAGPQRHVDPEHGLEGVSWREPDPGVEVLVLLPEAGRATFTAGRLIATLSEAESVMSFGNPTGL